MSKIESKIKELNIKLPNPKPPVGAYVATKIVRPLLQQSNWQECVNQMLRQREPVYLTADLTIKVQDGPPNVMVSRIIEAI